MRAFALLVILALVASPVVLAKHAPRTVVSGSFAIGEPIGYLLMDACGWPVLEGINSNCVHVPAGFGDHYFNLVARDGTGTLVGATVCFYTADRGISMCDPANRRVPAWATYMSVSSLGGKDVLWHLTL